MAQDELQRRLQRVGAAQAEMREAQAATDSKVESVATDVRDVAGRVGEVSARGQHRAGRGMQRCCWACLAGAAAPALWPGCSKAAGTVSGMPSQVSHSCSPAHQQAWAPAGSRQRTAWPPTPSPPAQRHVLNSASINHPPHTRTLNTPAPLCLQVHDDVHRLHDGLDRATLGIEAANRSIYLLCGAVVEVAKKVGLQGQHTLALDNMVTHGALPQAAPQGALPLQAPQRPMLQVGGGLLVVCIVGNAHISDDVLHCVVLAAALPGSPPAAASPQHYLTLLRTADTALPLAPPSRACRRSLRTWAMAAAA